MTYDPERHRRRSIRLKDYDYGQKGAYFVTLCTFERESYFEQFTELNEIVDTAWRRIPERFPTVTMDEYVIMPNHLHGIIVIDSESGYLDRRQPRKGYPQGVSLQGNIEYGHPDLGTIIGSYKSLCANAWLKVIKSRDINARGKFWQSNYYEHVIRNEEELNRIRNYIHDNPLKWESDRENPVNQNILVTKTLEEWMA
jgi:putative transposase